MDPWVGKIPWRRAWQPIAVFLPGESQAQRSQAGYSPWDGKESEMPQHNAQHSVATPSLLTKQAQIWRTILKTHPRDAIFHCRLSGSEGPLRAYTSSHFQLSRPVVPNLFGTSFAEDNFSMNQGARDAFRMIQVHYIYCVLYFYYYYVSSTSDHQALGPRDCRPML